MIGFNFRAIAASVNFNYRLALKKDPEYVRALLLLGQALLQKNLLDEAIEYLECAIAKVYYLIFLVELPHVQSHFISLSSIPIVIYVIKSIISKRYGFNCTIFVIYNCPSPFSLY